MSASDFISPHIYAEALATSRPWVRTTSAHLSRRLLALIEMAADFVTCATGMLAAVCIGGQAQCSVREIAGICIGFAILSVLLLHRNGAYDGGGSLLQIREAERAIRVPVQSLLVMLPLSLLLDLRLSKVLVIALVMIPLLLVAQKHGFVALVRALHERGRGIDRAVVYNVGGTAKRIVPALAHSVRLGLYPVAVVDDDPALNGQPKPEMADRRRRSVPMQCGPVTSTLLNSYQCSTLVIALPNLSSEKLGAAVNAAEQAGARIAFLSATELTEQQWTDAIDVDGFSLSPMLEPFEHWHYLFAKRLTDVILSSLLLVLLAPLFLLIVLLIRLDSPGPAFFSQERVGLRGEIFRMYKFRSMQVGARRYALSPVTSLDPRITRIGRMLRRTSLDELPQFVNVLLGQMSLVGPRPEMPFIVNGYTFEQRQRIQVTPGVTGLWQLSANRAFPIHENIQYDLYYIRNRAFFMDIAILMHTFFAMWGGV
jgi:exopolysaccharide biosynthesis polyprenyl glycosylphosphotransferase